MVDDLVARLCLTLVILWTVACQAPMYMVFSRQVRAERENLVLLRSVRHSFLLGLPERLHPGQFFIRLLVQIFTITLIFSAHFKPSFPVAYIAIGTAHAMLFFFDLYLRSYTS